MELGGPSKKNIQLEKKLIGFGRLTIQCVVRLKSTFVIKSCFVCVLQGEMCPFWSYFGCFGGGDMAFLPHPGSALG